MKYFHITINGFVGYRQLYTQSGFSKNSGVIQGFWSLNPAPTASEHVRQTSKTGFQTIETIEKLKNLVCELLNQDMNYFSSMISKPKLGEFIRISGQENTDEEKAQKFLKLIREV